MIVIDGTWLVYLSFLCINHNKQLDCPCFYYCIDYLCLPPVFTAAIVSVFVKRQHKILTALTAAISAAGVLTRNNNHRCCHDS